MEFEILVDQASLDRHRRGKLVFLMAFPLFFAGALARPVMIAMLGGKAGDWSANSMMLTGMLLILAFPLFGLRDVVSYRCPRCRRKLPRVAPQGVAEPAMHYACADCRVIWDLGWAWSGGGGEGGGG